MKGVATMSEIRANHTRAMVAVVVVLMAAVNGHSARIFYASFEDPVIVGQVTTPPTGWASATGANAGLSAGAVTGKTGNQFAWVGRFGGKLTTTSTVLSSNLEASVRYDLSVDVSASRVDGSYPWAIVELLAGTDVLVSTTNVVTTANNLSAQSISMTFIALSDNPYLGETLGIRLGAHNDAMHNQYFYYDNMALDATATTDDTTPPTPINMVWSGLPTSSVGNSITMQATRAVDDNGVQYFFTNTVNGNVSGWQDSPIWSDTGLTPGVTYSYKVKARDKSANTNETNWSSEESAVCEEHIILYESFENPSILPSTWLLFTTYPLPSAGWSSLGNTASIYNDSHATFPDTPFGEQYAAVRPLEGSHYLMGTNLNGRVLEAGYRYRVTYNAGVMSSSGATPRDNRYARATLMAGTNAVATSEILTTSNDLSEANTLEFIPDAAHPDLGEILKLKLDGYPDFHQDRVIFDNIKVYAIPPAPAGTLIFLR